MPSKEFDGIAMIEVRLFLDSPLNLYTLTTYGGDNDELLTVDNNLIFFESTDLVERAFQMLKDEIKSIVAVPTKVELIYRMSEAADLIRHKKVDDSAIILNCLNILFDLLTAARQPIPENYKDLLYKFADHLTFEREFDSFLSEERIERDKILNAFTWCIGAVVLRSRILR